MTTTESEALNSQILPKISEMHNMLRAFNSKEIEDFQQIIKNVEVVEDDLRDKQQECESYINEIKNKTRDQEKMGQLSKGVLEAKSQQIKSKVKNIDSVSTGVKETVAKIKPETLRKLPVNEDRNLKKLFETIYMTIYSEEKTEFNWDNFKKLALKHEDGEDFISRLVNLNFKELPNQKYDKLLELKNDPEFENMSIKSKHAEQIIDLADWVEYVCLGHQLSTEKKRAERDYDKIRKDIDKKSKGSLQMSQKFWKEASSEIETYQQQVQNINSELKSIFFGLKKSVEESNDIASRTKQKISEIEKSH